MTRTCRLLLILHYCLVGTGAINCYQCIKTGNDKMCTRYMSQTCPFGFFGCIKIATYSGGVDKMGNFINDDRSLISMVRGCNILPLGGVDACQQTSILGGRIVTCYCFNDYCNASRLLVLPFFSLLLVILVILIR